MLSRELADFLVELSIAMHKHAIYPPGHPLLEGAVDAVSRKLWGLLVDRPSLSIGVARRQLVIEGVATDPNHPLLQELAQRLHRHHLGAVKVTRGVERSEIAETLATLAMDAGRMERPLGLMTDELAGKWDHVRLYALTYDRLELLDDDSLKQNENQMGAGRAAQLWVGLARAALAADSTSAADDSTPLEPSVVARAIDEHLREQAYDQVIVGYMLQIANELKAGGGSDGQATEAAALQNRISRMLGALRPETLTRLLEMGGDTLQRRKFVLDATQGMTAEAVVDLLKAAAAAEKQTVSHAMIRVLSKMAKHAEAETTGESQRAVADRSLREAVSRLVGQWSIDDPNPEAYSAVLEQVSRAGAPNVAQLPNASIDGGGCEPERIVQMALELGVVGHTMWRAVDRVAQEGRVGALLEMVDGAPDRAMADAIVKHLADTGTLKRLLGADRIEFPVVERFVRLTGVASAPALLEAAERATEARARERLYEIVAKGGAAAVSSVAKRLAEASQGGGRAVAQRELLMLLGKLMTPEMPLPLEVDLRRFLRHEDAHVRREAVRLLLRGPKRDEALLAGLGDEDGRIVYLALTNALERCSREGLSLIRGRVERGELDASLRALGIRAVATMRTSDTLRWLIDRVTTRSALLRRRKLLPTSPETLAALTAIWMSWRQDPEAGEVLGLASRSKIAEVRNVVKGQVPVQPPRAA
ncbi:MAG TPA: hypothetical protein VGH98_17670 [Gemmatimonadaceae bacterium]|jgi:hypothetical protein